MRLAGTRCFAGFLLKQLQLRLDVLRVFVLEPHHVVPRLLESNDDLIQLRVDRRRVAKALDQHHASDDDRRHR